jgi:hypothetical protein
MIFANYCIFFIYYLYLSWFDSKSLFAIARYSLRYSFLASEKKMPLFSIAHYLKLWWWALPLASPPANGSRPRPRQAPHWPRHPCALRFTAVASSSPARFSPASAALAPSLSASHPQAACLHPPPIPSRAARATSHELVQVRRGRQVARSHKTAADLARKLQSFSVRISSHFTGLGSWAGAVSWWQHWDFLFHHWITCQVSKLLMCTTIKCDEILHEAQWQCCGHTYQVRHISFSAWWPRHSQYTGSWAQFHR